MRFIYTLQKGDCVLYDVDTGIAYVLGYGADRENKPTKDVVLFITHPNRSPDATVKEVGEGALQFWRALAGVVQDNEGRGSFIYGRMLNDLRLFKDGETVSDALSRAVLAAAEALEVCADWGQDWVELDQYKLPIEKHNNGYPLVSIAEYLRSLMGVPDA